MDKDIEHAEDYIQRLEDENASLRAEQERLQKAANDLIATAHGHNGWAAEHCPECAIALTDEWKVLAALISPARTEGQT